MLTRSNNATVIFRWTLDEMTRVSLFGGGPFLQLGAYIGVFAAARVCGGG